VVIPLVFEVEKAKVEKAKGCGSLEMFVMAKEAAVEEERDCGVAGV